MDREKLSVKIITHNEEENIKDCLESVRWADEIIIVDSSSTDRTLEICKEYTDKIFVNPWEGMKEQKNFALSKASNQWVLSLDADERVTEELREFMLKELENPSFDGYRFPRKNYFLGKWLRYGGWYPDLVLRFFNKNKGYFGGINPHDRVIIESDRVKTVPFHITHNTYKSISQYLMKQNLYSGVSAMEKVKAGKRVSPYLIPAKTVWKFVETFFIKKGFLDGFHGFIAAMGATYSTFWKYVKMWELCGRKK